MAIGGKPASVCYVSPNQLNVLAPTVNHATSSNVTVTNSIGSSDSVKIGLAAFQPAFFTLAGEYVAAIRADGSVAAPSGLTLSAAAPLDSPGLYQFNFIAPNLPDGDYPLTASVGGVRTGKIARLRIAK